METKVCLFCKEEKLLSDYYKDKSGKLGVQSGCKPCKQEYQRKYLLDKDVNLKMAEWHKNYYKKNKDKALIKHKIWIKNNRNKIRETANEYYKKNAKLICEKNQIYKVKRKEIDPLFKLKIALRGRTGTILKHKGYKKNTKTETILGASFDICKLHIEKKFTKGMNWSNYGKGEGRWNIDHKIPLASANTEEDLIKLCHYTNLQPLWETENMKKSDKILPIQTTLIL